ncbi:DUF1579 domain-containing protein [Flaviaesturariibacter terrae]
MKNWIPAALLLGLAACNSETKPIAAGEPVIAAAHSDAPGTEAAKSRPDSAAQARNCQVYMTPGPEQKMLKEANGTWDAEVTMWMGPGAPEQKASMTTVNKMLLGDRYQQSTHSGNMMGMSFEGISTLAFDNHKKKFVSTWIDNMGTGIVEMEGSFDSTTKTISFTGRMMDPSLAEETNVRETYTLLDADHHLMQMYGTGPDGKEFKTMQVHYRRKK